MFSDFRKTQTGFTLVELSIVLMIVGLITGSVFAFMKQDAQHRNYQETVDRQQTIAAAMTEHVQRTGVLPCPAESDPTAPDLLGQAPVTCNTSAERTGIVPFRDLGLQQDDIIDGYGNPFTYVVSDAAVNPDDTAVHQSCRVVSPWFPHDPVAPTVPLGPNNHPRKAAFCCQQATGADVLTIRVIEPDGTLSTDTVIADQSGGLYDPVDTAFTGVLDPTDRIAYVAYALISHGANGAGAWIIEGARNALDGAGDNERENADDDNDFAAGPRFNVSGADYFDDIVLWRTQQRTINGLNNDSCARP